MQLNERCVKCSASMEYLADYEGIPIDKMLVEVSLADLAASQLNAQNQKSKFLKKLEKPLENYVEPVKYILQNPVKNSE